MDNIPTGSMQIAANLSRNNSRVNSYPVVPPWEQHTFNDAIMDLEADQTIDTREGIVTMEHVNCTRAGLIHTTPSTWPTQCNPLSAIPDEGNENYATYSLESGVLNGLWGTVSSEPSLDFTNASDNQINIHDENPSIATFNRCLENGRLGFFDENQANLVFDHRLGSGNPMDIVNFENTIGNMPIHGSLGIANSSPAFSIPAGNDTVRIAGFDENRERLNRLHSESWNMTDQNQPTLEAVSDDDPPWRHFPGVPHFTGCRDIVAEAGLGVDSNSSTVRFNPYLSIQDTACALAQSSQSEGAAGPQVDNASNLSSNLGTGVNFEHDGGGCGNSDVKPKSQEVRTRNRHSKSKWEKVEPHIKRLYLDEKHTAEEVAFVMAVIHGFESSVSTIRKKVQHWRKDERTRVAKQYPKRKDQTPKAFNIISEEVRKMEVQNLRREEIMRKEEHERQRQIQIEKGNKRGHKKRWSKKQHAVPNTTEVNLGPFLSTVYIHQEKLFHAIDTYFKGLFAAGLKSWTTDGRHFIPPQNTPDFSEAWQLLSDQVESVSMLIGMQLYHHANFMLGEILARLRVAVRVCDPSFMIHFWKICHVLASIPIPSRRGFKGSPWLGWFLQSLRQTFSSVFGMHPLVVITDSLLQVWYSSPRDLKATFGLGHWKAIHTLGGLIGNGNNIVLNMGVCCTKTWKSKFSVSNHELKTLYHRPMAITPNLEAEQSAEVFLDYLFAASREKYNELGVFEEASHVLKWTTSICHEKAKRCALQYDSVTRAFVFSSELVATHHLETWKEPEQEQKKLPDFRLSQYYMDEAIQILRYGDLQCRIRAASFSKRLSTWFRAHRPKAKLRPKLVVEGEERRKALEEEKKKVLQEERKKVLQEKARTREIVQDITKLRIRGSRRRRWLRGVRRQIPRDGRIVEKGLLVASVLPQGQVLESQTHSKT
ncbi:hypothetical protein VM1G_06554 [Cytospora mali]|uniref:Clr5 domain-containing protein n=1 Tax=Cytospora mali TaxID=578113 RepID=A0A194W1U2_CYTMA|nr:hypothetical protein VM1G_06554 [Valsa mali]